MERVNTGGLIRFEYPKGHKFEEDKDFNRRLELSLRVGRRRLKREKIKRNIFLGIGIIVLGILSLYFKKYFWSSIVILIGVSICYFHFMKMLRLKKNKEWITQEYINYYKENE